MRTFAGSPEWSFATWGERGSGRNGSPLAGVVSCSQQEVSAECRPGCVQCHYMKKYLHMVKPYLMRIGLWMVYMVIWK